MRFADRADAGRRLATAVAGLLADRPELARRPPVVLGLPRGGVPVAAEVARELGAPLDVLVVRKLGLPGQPELAMGAIAGVAGDIEAVRNDAVLALSPVDEESFQDVYADEVAELRRRESAYRGDRPPATVEGCTTVVVDDGLATGSTMRAAVTAVRHGRPAAVVVAVPVGSRDTCARLAGEVDEVVCLTKPRAFTAVGQAYLDFSPTSDDEVRRALAEVSG
ncbi:MAG TPA: phosphoribosyltransferase family protein [Actinomycetes bacterium]|nr:phosphoribosyltransferase family protein [Actinomycetes bacterium]